MNPSEPKGAPIEDVIKKMAHNLRTQDGRGTANPMFVAQIFRQVPKGSPGKWIYGMVTFTEEGAKEFLRLNAPKEKTRIGVDSFTGCPEMESIRKWILNWDHILAREAAAQERIAWLEGKLTEAKQEKEKARLQTKEARMAEKRRGVSEEACAKERDTAKDTLKAIVRLGRKNREYKLAHETLLKLGD